jgi:hypothetical protein
VSRTVVRTLVLAVLLGAALIGYLRATRSVSDRWGVKERGGWWTLGVVSLCSAVVFVILVFRQYAGALVIALAAVATFWLPGVLRRRSRPGS